MRLRRFILTSLVLVCILGAGIALALRFDDTLAQYLVFGTALLFSLAVIRSNALTPFLVDRRWRRYADARGDRYRTGRHDEPRMSGERDGVRFSLALSTSFLGTGGGFVARTIATSAIEEGVPDGLCVHTAESEDWLHRLSGLREVEMEDEEIDATLMVEGSDPDVTRAWVLEHRETLLELAAERPTFIVWGSEVAGIPAEAGGASGAVTIPVFGRRSKEAELDALIDEICGAAGSLSA